MSRESECGLSLGPGAELYPVAHVACLPEDHLSLSVPKVELASRGPPGEAGLPRRKP